MKKKLVDIFRDVFKGAGASVTGDDKKMDRRKFFRAGLAEMLKPLDSAIRPLERVAHEVGKLDSMVSPAPAPRLAPVADRPWLRPPGALPELEFRDRCTKCGDCVAVCPVHAIRVDATEHEGGGFPYIDANISACTMCDGQPCMPACIPGALMVTSPDLIDMGLANYFDQTCLRINGEECTLCVDHCPVGSKALEVQDGWIVVHEEGCTGCGMCQNNCPTDPKSIIVIPKAASEMR
jgi:ferredoxin-type protein NapG